MNLPDATRTSSRPCTALISFLTDRLREDLGEIWHRGDPPGPGRPGMAAQLGIIDDLLRMLASGRLPVRTELRMLFLAYGQHPEFDRRWDAYLR